MKYLILLLIIVLSLQGANGQQKSFYIQDYGANAKNKNNAKAVQLAIDKAFAAGGGRVVVPKGRFVIGPIVLKSGVELNLQKGSVLLGSTNRLDYGNEKAEALIQARQQNCISITGKGEIDGRGAELVDNVYRLLRAGVIADREWKTKRPNEDNRPKLIHFVDCKNVIIRGVSIKNGAGWTQDYERCINILVDSVSVNAVCYWNNDGLDITDSKNVTITNCYMDVADDGICLKSEGENNDSCVNVYIANCKLRSSANAVKLGTASSGGFRNIIIHNIEVWDTYRSAIALEAVDGGFLENVDIQNIKAVNTGNAVFIKLGHRNSDNRYSKIRNINIKNMHVEVPLGKPDKGYKMEGPLLRYPKDVFPAKNGEVQSVSPWNNSGLDSTTAIVYKHNVFPSSITGLPDHEVEDVTLENVEIIYEGGADSSTAFFPLSGLTSITEAEAAYPEFSMFGELPVWGLYVRHAKGITLKNVTIRSKKEDFRVPVIFDDVQNLHLEKLKIPDSKEMPAVLLHKVKDYSFKDLELPRSEAEAIKIQR